MHALGHNGCHLAQRHVSDTSAHTVTELSLALSCPPPLCLSPSLLTSGLSNSTNAKCFDFPVCGQQGREGWNEAVPAVTSYPIGRRQVSTTNRNPAKKKTYRTDMVGNALFLT